MKTAIDLFLARWQTAGGAERANYQMFLAELCDILQVAHPDPTTPEEAKNVYVFDRAITATNADGTTSPNYIDLYKRAHFVLETKQGVDRKAAPAGAGAAGGKGRQKKGHGVRGSKIWDDSMLRAKAQAEGYVRSIPDDNPPFLLVVDVGYSVETYADFSGLGKTYTPFPDNRSHRFKLTDLAGAERGKELVDRLARIWTDPQSLNPARRTAKITREIAGKLAELSRSLEKSGHHAESVAQFLMRCLFTCFAEDVHLLGKKKDPFTNLLRALQERPENFAHSMQALWHEMDRGGYSGSIQEKILQFNGSLFKDTQALPLSSNQIGLLIEAAEKDWTDVEPAIFGTLLERALDATERHKLGAHYTPRAYVERLVLPTVIEPLREQWAAARGVAVDHANNGELKKAIKAAGDFLKLLCNTTVLDPACGSGNFLYVTLEHMKRLEGEVHDFLAQFPNTQLPLEYTGLTVDPHNFRGIEINPRAAAITDLVLWIGYLQWHFRTHGNVMPPAPVLKKLHNIENRDAILAFESKELAIDDTGKPISRWNGKTFKISSLTNEEVPDETARTANFVYTKARRSEWPEADYVVGNPPFLGNKRMRLALGDGYVEALRAAVPVVPETADFVFYWWDKAADLLLSGKISRFGFITTNTISQTFNRGVVEKHLAKGLHLAFAIGDHPWVDASDGAGVRIAMTVGSRDKSLGVLATVRREEITNDHDFRVELSHAEGIINATMSTGADFTTAAPLHSNLRLSYMGVILCGDGFFIDSDDARLVRDEAAAVGLLAKYVSGTDLARNMRGREVLDFHGLSETDARKRLPEAYQWVLERVKPRRMQSARKNHRENWWIYGESRPGMRHALAGLNRFIVTARTAKYRVFQFLPRDYLVESNVIAIASDDPFVLGVLNSRIHVLWAAHAGATLEDRPHYTNTTAFDPFPFPDASEKQKQRIRAIAEDLDAHRKRQQAKFPGKNGLTLTDMYNTLEKLRAIEAGKLTAADLSPFDKQTHERGLVSILKQLHDDLDAAVFEAYGWSTSLTDDQLLEKLVALNHQRAAEEKRGIIKYLRPEFQRAHCSPAKQGAGKVAVANGEN